LFLKPEWFFCLRQGGRNGSFRPSGGDSGLFAGRPQLAVSPAAAWKVTSFALVVAAKLPQPEQ
jgi:hypothetical protein